MKIKNPAQCRVFFDPNSISAHDYMMTEITVDEAGYALVYISNEDPEYVEVYFDDVTITHTPTNIIQYNEYYPYGLQAATSWTRANHSNDYLYNQGSELNATTGYYETPLRLYDAAIGRFMGVDVMAGMYANQSPYQYANNNPISFNDPTGAAGNGANYGHPDYDWMFGGYKSYDQYASDHRAHYANMNSSYYGYVQGSSPDAYNIMRNYMYGVPNAISASGNAWRQGHYENRSYFDYSTEYINGEEWTGATLIVNYQWVYDRDQTSSDGIDWGSLGSDENFILAGGFGSNVVEDYRNTLTGISLSTEGYAINELSNLPKNPVHGTRHLIKLRGNYLRTLAKKAGVAGTVFSAWEATEKGWTTGATVSFAADVAVVGLSILCPVCGIVYGVGRLGLDLYGIDIADKIDEKFGSDSLWDSVGEVWK